MINSKNIKKINLNGNKDTHLWKIKKIKESNYYNLNLIEEWESLTLKIV
jgi:hypothetical protein